MFADAEHGRLLTTMHEESAIRTAIRSGEFVVHFQPIIELATGDLSGAEALVRWERPGVGLVPPNDFLPAVGRAGLAVELGWSIIDQAFEAWGRLLALLPAPVAGRRRPSVSVNVDAAQLALPELSSFVLESARRHSVPAESVVIEVTEHALAAGPGDGAPARTARQRHPRRPRRLRHRLLEPVAGEQPASRHPQDRSQLHPDRHDAGPGPPAHRRHLPYRATLGLRITAEGVESQDVVADLRDLGVDYAQGYLFSKAIPAEDFARWSAGRVRAVTS